MFGGIVFWVQFCLMCANTVYFKTWDKVQKHDFQNTSDFKYSELPPPADWLIGAGLRTDARVLDKNATLTKIHKWKFFYFEGGNIEFWSYVFNLNPKQFHHQLSITQFWCISIKSYNKNYNACTTSSCSEKWLKFVKFSVLGFFTTKAIFQKEIYSKLPPTPKDCRFLLSKDWREGTVLFWVWKKNDSPI